MVVMSETRKNEGVRVKQETAAERATSLEMTVSGAAGFHPTALKGTARVNA